ncbi:MAG: leucine-rich repeat protein [Clostridia bacterium]|nr:leucine-rich repeat protein [Clostridia bacterium]
MTNLNKKFALLICLVLSLVMLFALSSCGGEEPPANDDSQNSTQTGTNTDTGTDSSTDTSTDTSVDSGTNDSNTDTSVDSGTTDSSTDDSQQPDPKPEPDPEPEPDPVVTYTVTFVQEGFANVVKTVNDGEALTDIPTPQAVQGYEIKWEEKDLTNIQTNITVNAVKTPVEYNVIYVLNGGTNNAQNPDKYTVEQEFPLVDPSKTGYTFAGWYSDSDFTTAVSNIEIGETGSKTFYAKWMPNENTLAFNANGGNGSMENMSIPTSNTVNLKANTFTKDGYTFKGWSTTSNGSVSYADEASYTMGTNSSYTLYAVWEANQNTIVFNANGGTGTMENMTIATDSQANLTANSFVKAGYSFIGWATTEDGSVSYTDEATYTMGTESTYTLYAVWQANENTLVFNANGGSGTMSNVVSVTDSTVALPSNLFTRENYDFMGWSTTQDGEVEYQDGDSYIMGAESTKTLYAVWEEKKNSIVFDSNGGTGEMSDLRLAEGETANLPANAFTKAGYKFTGWSTSKDGIVEYKDEASYTMGTKKTTTFYAMWEIETYKLTYDTLVSSNPRTYSLNTLPITLYPAATEAGKAFVGWCTTSDFSDEPFMQITEPIGTVKLYAKFVDYTEGLVFTDNGDTYSVTDYTGTSANIVIPDIIAGKKVTVIADNVFSNCTGITSIKLPQYLVSIGKNAFKGCTLLASIDLPETVTTIGNDAFSSCSALTSVNYFGDIDSWCTISFGNTNSNPLNYSKKLLLSGEAISGNIVISEGITLIPDYTFYNCSQITGIELSSTVTTIGTSAFDGCTSMSSVTLGENVSSIGCYAFRNCPKLTNVNYVGDIESWCNVSFTNSYSNPLNYSKKLYLNGQEISGKIVIPETVTQIPAYTFCNCTKITSVVIPNSITTLDMSVFDGCTGIKEATVPMAVITAIPKDNLQTIVISNGTKIPDTAFEGCISLSSVTIPNTVTEIGSGAFYGCTSIVNITIPNSVKTIGDYAFENCYSLKSIVLPDSVTAVGEYAFYDCSSLESVTASKNLTSIEATAFEACTNIKEATAPMAVISKIPKNKLETVVVNGGTEISSSAFKDYKALKNVTISGGITKIGSSAFSGCSLLSSVTIGNTVTTVEANAFENCTSLGGVTVPNSVTSIGSSVFKGCTSLANVTLGSGVKSVGSYAFSGCTALKNITVPNNVTSIGDYAFNSCTSLEKITLSKNLTSVSNSAFNGCASIKEATIPVVAISALPKTKLQALTINSGTEIPASAYEGCTSLKNVTIGDTVTSIGNGAFYDCASLESVAIGNSVIEIGSSAFESCVSLKNVSLGNKVATIGEYAFYDCTSLASIDIPSSVTSIKESAFDSCSLLEYSEYGNAYYLGNSEKSYLALIKVKSENITSCEIHSETMVIADDAFRVCTTLTSLTISKDMFESGTASKDTLTATRKCQTKCADL